MVTGYASLTITDLLDTATYIYYSPNLDGSGATTAPETNSKYIGIYSGPTLPDGQPQPGTDAFNEINNPKNEHHIEWMEAKGKPGEDGKTTVLKESITEYYQSEEERTETWLEENLSDNDWKEDMPNLIAGHFLYMKITETWGFEDDDSSDKEYVRYQSSRSGIDGIDANIYELVINPEEIIRRFKPINDSELSQGYQIEYDEDIIRIYPYKSTGETKELYEVNGLTLYLILNSTAYKISYLIENYNKYFSVGEDNNFWELNITGIINNDPSNNGYLEEETIEEEKTITEFKKIKNFFSEITSSILALSLLKDESSLLNIMEENDSNNWSSLDSSALSKKAILIRDNFTDEMAKFYLHANDITMAINDANLKFDSSGLTLTNGGIVINKDKENNIERIFYFDEETGNLVLKGDVYADNGVFNGVVNATDGSFSGSINAKQGEIGGFSIKREVEYIKVSSPLEQDLSKYFEQKIEIKTEDGNTTQIVSYVKTSDIEIDSFKTYYEEKIKENYLESSDGNIKLDGLNGLIEAEEIYLGIGAKITNWIELGGTTIDGQVYPSAFIYNPAAKEGKFIEAGALKIDSNGKVETGTITIDGTTSKINIGDNIVFDGLNKTLYSNSWKITPDKSVFNNVVVKGCIEAASFEYGEVTTVGGILFIKASSAITDVDINAKTVTIKYVNNNQISKGLFAVNDICCFSTNLSDSSLSNSTIWRITGVINNSESTTLTLKTYDNDNNENNANNLTTDLIGGSIYKIGTLDEDNELSDNLGIGINSSSNPSFLPSQSLSIVELTKENNNFKYINRLILGNLASIGEIDYGLYADNVILNGKLVSKNKDDLTAGINSKGQGEMPSDNESYPWHSSKAYKKDYVSPGKIILWAGGKGSTSATEAKFKVDENGNLYSSSAYFKGAIVTDSTIESAELKTAIITGTGTGGYGLTIRNVANGILFKNKNECGYYFKLNNETTDINTPTVKAKGLYVSENYATFKNNFSFNDISIFGEKISYIPNNISNDGAMNLSESGETYIGFNNKQIDFFEKVLIEDNYTTVNNNLIFNGKEINYAKGKANIKMVEKGYDIYVSE